MVAEVDTMSHATCSYWPGPAARSSTELTILKRWLKLKHLTFLIVSKSWKSSTLRANMPRRYQNKWVECMQELMEQAFASNGKCPLSEFTS